ncbi:MAG: hypothetical protein AAF652_01365 [Cyanobacteria bacterium P01_C01_bin.72]
MNKQPLIVLENEDLESLRTVIRGLRSRYSAGYEVLFSVLRTFKTNASLLFIGEKSSIGWLQNLITGDRHSYILLSRDLVRLNHSAWDLRPSPLQFATCIPGILAIADVYRSSVIRFASAMSSVSCFAILNKFFSIQKIYRGYLNNHIGLS